MGEAFSREQFVNSRSFDIDELWKKKKRITVDALTPSDKKEIDDEAKRFWFAMIDLVSLVGTDDFEESFTELANQTMAAAYNARDKQKKIKREFLGWINDLLTMLRWINEEAAAKTATKEEFEKEMNEFKKLVMYS